MQELEGHTETVEFASVNHDGKYLLTAGMDNEPRVWDIENGFSLKRVIEYGSPSDINFARWHPKGNIVIFGGKDNTIWMYNGINGDFISCCAGHEGDVLDA